LNRWSALLAIAILSLVQVCPLSSEAAITISSLPSHLSPVTDNKTIATIYAGKSSDISACSASLSTDPCDTCAAVTTVAATTTCNKTSIYPAHVFSITFLSDSTTAFTASSKVMMLNGSTYIVPLNATSMTLAANTAMTDQLKWANICDNFSGGSEESNCNYSFSKSVTVGVSKDGTTAGMTDSFTLQINFRSLASAGGFAPAFHTNCSTTAGVCAIQNEGVCGFAVQAGDSKVYFGNILIPLATAGSTVNSWPGTETAGVNWAGIKIYYRAATDQTATTTFSPTEWSTR